VIFCDPEWNFRFLDKFDEEISSLISGKSIFSSHEFPKNCISISIFRKKVYIIFQLLLFSVARFSKKVYIIFHLTLI